MAVAPLARGGSLLAFTIAFSACILRDPGHDLDLPGPVRAEDLCGTPPPHCPACSIAEGPLCRDQFYGGAYRCGVDGGGHCETLGGACRAGWCVLRDDDGDGVDDHLERAVAERNLPALAFHAGETCGAPRAVVYDARPHPKRPGRLAVTYVLLYNRDCGALNGHLGDNEAFAITVDLETQPGAAATVGLVTQAHRNTLCDSVSTCQTAPATEACATLLPGVGRRLVVYTSRDKHGNYLDLDTCNQNCFDSCGSAILAPPQVVNIGGPEGKLGRDLTAEGVLRAVDGWAADLLHFDIWGDLPFGQAGRPREQLELLLPPPGS